MNASEPTQFDTELSILTDAIERIRSRVRSAETDVWEEQLQAVITRLSTLSERVDKLANYVSASLTVLGENSHRALDELADLSKQSSTQSHLLAQSVSTQTSAAQPKIPSEAVRALIAAHDQLTVVAESDTSHGDVLRGQRDNLKGTILQLGFREMAPQPGSVFDPLRARSEFETTETSDPKKHNKVAVLEQVGWEAADGSGIVRPPAVRVFEYKQPPEGKQSARTDPHPLPRVGKDNEQPPPATPTPGLQSRNEPTKVPDQQPSSEPFRRGGLSSPGTSFEVDA